jgi:hypothetical protein
MEAKQCVKQNVKRSKRNILMKHSIEMKRTLFTPWNTRGRIVTLALLLNLHSVEEL